MIRSAHWLRNAWRCLSRPRRRTPIRTRPRLEVLEDRIAPVTQIDFGGLRFLASTDFTKDVNRDDVALSGTVSIGYTPAGQEAFRPLLLDDLTEVGGSLTLSTATTPAQPQFSLLQGQLNLVAVGGSPTVPIPILKPLFLLKIDITHLTGSGFSLPDGLSPDPIEVAKVDFTLSGLGFANPNGGDTSDAQVKMQGTASFEKIPVLEALHVTASVEGDNYVIAKKDGIELTGLDAHAQLPTTATLKGMKVAGKIDIGYTHDTNEFSFSGGIQLTSQDGGNSSKPTLDSVGATLDLTYQNGTVSKLGFSIDGQFSFRSIQVSTIQDQPLAFNFNFQKEQYEISGGLQFDVGGSTVAVDLGNAGAPGIIIQNGQLTIFNGSVKGKIDLKKVIISTTGPNGLTFSYNRAQDQFEMSGGLQLQIPTGNKTQIISATMSDANGGPGLIIEDGQLQKLALQLTGGFDIYSLKINVTNASVDWTSATDTLFLSGTFSVDFDVFQTTLTLGNGSPNSGLKIENGKFSVDSISWTVEGVERGPLTINELHVAYQADGTSYDLDVDVNVTIAGSITVDGEFDIVHGKFDTISIDVSVPPETIPIADTGLSIIDMHVKVTNIDDPPNIVVTGGIAVVWGEAISLPFISATGYLFRAEGDVTVDANEFVLDCQAQLGAYTTDSGSTWQAAFGSGDAKLTLDWQDNFYALHVAVDGLMGVFDIEGDLVFSPNKDIALLAEATVVIPSWVPFIGGDTIGGLGFFFQHVWAHGQIPTSTTFAAWLDLNIIVWQAEIGFEFVIDQFGHVNVALIGNGTIDQFRQDVQPPVNQTYTFTADLSNAIPQNATSAIVSADWSQSAASVDLESVKFRVKRFQNGQTTIFTEDQFEANGIKVISDAALSGKTKKTIQIVGSTTDRYAPIDPTIQYTVLVDITTQGGNPFPDYPDPNAPDVLLVQTTYQRSPPVFGPPGATAPFVWNMPANPPGDFPVTLQGGMDETLVAQATVSLYRVKVSDPFRRGVLLGKVTPTALDPSKNNGQTWQATFTVPIEGLFETQYVLYAVVNDGFNAPVQSGDSAAFTLDFAVAGQVTNQNGDPLGGWEVFLDYNPNGVRDPNEPVTHTNAGGFYSFTREFSKPGIDPVPVGRPLDVRLKIPAPDQYVLDNNPVIMEFDGTHTATVNFTPRERSSIKGTVFEDVLNNGVTADGKGVAGAVVYLDTNGNGVRDAGEPRAVTNSTGRYDFANLKPGTYQVALDLSTLSHSTPVAAYDVPADTVGNNTDAHTLGMEFNVNQPIEVTSLGVFDSGGDGLKVPITATLYDRVTHLALAQVVFQPGSGTLVGGSRFLPLDKPITLLPGFQGVIAASGYGPQEPWAEVRPDGIVTAVNAGGAADGRYLKDADFSGGSTFQTQAAIDTSHDLNPAPQAVYQTGRFGRNPDGSPGDFTYTFGALQAEVRQGGTYTVRLHFAEPFFHAPGQRLFDVAINGTTVLKNFDIFAAAGAIDTAVVREFNIVPNADGQIVIDFKVGSADLPMVNGIELLRPGVENAPWKTNGDVGALTFVGGGLFGLPSEYPANDGGNSMPNPYAAGTFQYREPAWEQTKNTPKTYSVTIDGSGFDLQEKKDFAALPPAFIAGTITGHPLQPNGQVQPNAVPQPGTTVQLLNAAFVTGVNAGGLKDGRYLADTDFSGGSTFSNPAAIDTSHVFDPAPQAVYKTGRFGKNGSQPANFTYTIPGLKAEASYTVRLHFAEPYFHAPRQRLFGVAINGTTVLKDFDIFATAGNINTAVTQEFNASADADGKIVILFKVGSADLPMVNGIEILQPGTVLATTTTDVRGQYDFPVYAPGPYTVQEAPPEGWRQVAPFHSDLTMSAAPFPQEKGSRSVAVADFNADGYADIAWVGSDLGSPVQVAYNQKDGTFGTPLTYYPQYPYQGEYVVTGDFNGDHLPDLAVLSSFNGINFLSILLNTGNPDLQKRFQSAADYWLLPPSLQQNTAILSIAVGDLNKDGLDDLLLSYQTAGKDSGAGVAVLLNAAQASGRKVVTYALPNEGGANQAGGLTVGDINGDGALDVLVGGGVVDPAFEGFSVAFGDGKGGLLPWTEYTVNTLTGGNFGGPVALGDIQGKGFADVALMGVQPPSLSDPSHFYAVQSATNRGNGVFDIGPVVVDQKAYPTVPPATRMLLRDLNGDLKPDLVLLLTSQFPFLGPDAFVVFVNTGVFPYFDLSQPLRFPIPGAPVTFEAGDLAVADVNNDGLNDVIVVNQFGGKSGESGFVFLNRTPQNEPGFPVTLQAGQLVTTADFLNVQKPPQSAVHGQLFEDVNRNGRQDTGETGTAGSFVFVDLNRNRRYDPGEPSALTRAHGVYSIAGLADGSYSVGVVPEDGWKTTSPTEFVEVTVSGGSAARADFGRVRRLLQPIADQSAQQSTAFAVQALLTEWATQSGRKWLFSLDAGAPAGATINPTTGLLTWTPSAPGTYPVTVRVSDPFEPLQNEAVTFTVSVAEPPVVPPTPIGPPVTPPAKSTVGVFDPLTGTWYLKNTNQPGAPDVPPFRYGAPSWTPLTGDWDGDGSRTIGVFDPLTATWYLRNSNSPGAPDIPPFAYGTAGWIPVVGDWDGNGTMTIGVVDPATMTWYLKNSNGPGAPDYGPFRYGQAGDVPVVGDWNGDGATTIGVWRPGTATWYLRNSNSPGAPDITPFAYGQAGDVPVTGDWNGDRVTTVGVFRPGTASWFLRDSNTPGAPDVTPFAYGGKDWLPVTGPYTTARLLRAGEGPPTGAAPAAPLSQAALDAVVGAARSRLQTAGIDGALLGRLSAAQFQVSDLPAGDLGMAFPGANLVQIDRGAAGLGWFVDPTPLADEEFTPAPSGALVAPAGTPAGEHRDLLTAVLHELGHLAGLPDVSTAAHPADLMGDQLAEGVRLTAALDRVFTRGPF
jgi:hypothetical protein